MVVQIRGSGLVTGDDVGNRTANALHVLVRAPARRPGYLFLDRTICTYIIGNKVKGVHAHAPGQIIYSKARSNLTLIVAFLFFFLTDPGSSRGRGSTDPT